MTTTNIDIKVNVFSQLQKLQKDLIGVQKNLKSMGRPVQNIGQAYENLQKRVQAYTSTLKQANQVALSGLFKEPIRSSQRFQDAIQKNTNALLSLLFLGIWLQQVMTGAMKSIFEGYKKAIPEGHKFNQMTNKLSANWEYFKFQLADALANSPLFQKFVMFLINILKRLQALSPEAKVFLTVMISLVAVLGGVLFVVAQIGLGMQGILMITTLLQDKVNSFSWGKLAAFAAVLSAVLAVATAIVLLGKSISDTREKSELFDEKWTNILDLFKDVINTAISPLGVELQTMGEVMFWVSGIAQILFASFTQGLNTLISFVKFVTTTAFSGFRILIGVFKDIAEAAVAAWNAIQGKGFDSSAFNLSNVTDSMNAVRDDLTGIWKDWQDNTKNIADNTLSFAEIKEEIAKYRAELDKTTKSTESLVSSGAKMGQQSMILDSLLSSEFKVPETNKQSSNTTNNLYLDGELLTSKEGISSGISDIINQIQDDLNTDLGYNN